MDDHSIQQGCSTMNMRLMLATTLATAIFPAHISRIDFRKSTGGLVIELEKNSPAYAALEDVQTDYHKLLKQKTDAPAKDLQLMVRQPQRQTPDSIINMHKVAREATTELKGLTITALKHDGPQPIDFAEYASAVVQREIENRNAEDSNYKENNYKTLSTSTGGKIYVAGGSGGFGRNALATKKNEPNVFLRKERPQDRSPRPSIEVPPTIVASRESSYLAAKKDGGFKVKGPIRFIKGAALVGDSQLTVHQVIDGHKTAQGYVNLNDAFYDIDFDKMEGEIIAEVRAAAGELQALGRVNLYDFKVSGTNHANISGVALEVVPTSNSASGTVLSSAVLGGSGKTVSHASVVLLGSKENFKWNGEKSVYENEHLVIPSQFIAQSNSKGNWGSLFFGRSGENFRAHAFQDNFINALLKLSSDKYTARDISNSGVLWGKVTMFGLPVEGSKVELVGESAQQPIYFSGFLPDKGKTATTKTGELAFAGLPNGEKLIQVSLGQKKYWPVMSLIKENHVTYADLQIHAPTQIRLASENAMTGEPMAALVRPLGSDDEIIIPENGPKQLAVELIGGLTLLEAEADSNYFPSRAIVQPGQFEVDFKFFTNDHIKNLMSTHAGGSPFRSAVYGEVGDIEFRVSLSEDYATAKIVYVDERGHILPAGDSKVRGYFVFGLPMGLHTIFIDTNLPNSARISTIVYVDEYALNYTKTNITF